MLSFYCFPINVFVLTISGYAVTLLSYNHTERHASRQASAASEVSDLCNRSGTHLERQVKRHHRLALVTLLLLLDVPLDARCGYTLRMVINSNTIEFSLKAFIEIAEFSD